MTAPQRRSNNRLDLLLDAAASRFARHGYRETTVREIAAAVDMLPGSVYYHFPSKERLLLAVYREGVSRVCARVDGAIDTAGPEPWARLELALVAHLDCVLDRSDYARVMLRVLPDSLPDIAADLVALRDSYEQRFKRLVDALPLPDPVDGALLRLFLLGAANWSEIWYRPGRATPADIARRFLHMLREPMDLLHERKP
jgi:TetR/AcrR family transcriptional regulator, cholesterol catabolism regulator